MMIRVVCGGFIFATGTRPSLSRLKQGFNSPRERKDFNGLS